MSLAAPDRPASPDAALAAGPLRVGVFDSGLGGLSVLRALQADIPGASYIYAADSGHAPYGERDDDFITRRSQHLTEFLIQRGAQVVVVACNTATATSIHRLREHFHTVPIIGVEPGIKPAIAQSISKKVGVFATPRTLASEKFQRLVAAHGQGVELVLQPCPGLAREIEQGDLARAALAQMVQGFCAPMVAAGVDTAVLGCTHYPFVEHLFQQALGPKVTLIDTAHAVARQTARVTGAPALAFAGSPPAAVEFWTSGDAQLLRRVVHEWLGLQAIAQALA